ncbi:MAG: agglutinin biogenesis protein MshI [Massilia sp.]|nr:agglutinin biogenesis protein MshI [Massilia sp.]
MRFFAKKKKNQGWLTIAFLGDGLAAAKIRRMAPAKPAVELGVFFPDALLPPALMLDKLAKELQAHRYQCTMLLDAGEYQLLAVEALNVPPDELKTAMRWRLKDMLDFHVDDATIDVLEIPADKAAVARASHGMFAVAARNSVIEQRQNLFAAAKLNLSVIDIPEMAQRNIAALVEPEGHGVAMLSFNADGGLLTITFKGELYLSRRIDIAQAQLMVIDMDQLHATFDRITLELQRSLDHFDRQFHFINVSRLILAPNVAPGLEPYLASNLYMPVESLDLGAVLDLSQVPQLATIEQQQRFFLTLGAALRVEEVLL